MAFAIRNQIEAELNYPGTIEITVIREQPFRKQRSERCLFGNCCLL